MDKQLSSLERAFQSDPTRLDLLASLTREAQRRGLDTETPIKNFLDAAIAFDSLTSFQQRLHAVTDLGLFAVTGLMNRLKSGTGYGTEEGPVSLALLELFANTALPPALERLLRDKLITRIEQALPRVLIADDSALSRKIQRQNVRICRGQAQDFIEVRDARLALQALSKNGLFIRLVLLDENLPDMKGSELLQALQPFQLLKAVPVIAIGTEAEIAPCMIMGAWSWMSAPLHSEVFATRLRDIQLLANCSLNKLSRKRLEATLTVYLSELLLFVRNLSLSGTLTCEVGRIEVEQGSLITCETKGSEGEQAFLRLAEGPRNEWHCVLETTKGQDERRGADKSWSLIESLILDL